MDPLLETEKQLKEVYKQASIEAQMKTDRFFAKFRQLDKIKQEQVAKGELDKSTYLEWRKNKMLMGQRYQDLVNTLTADMTHANQIAASIVNGHTPEAYANGMNHGTYEVEHGARVNTNFTLYNRHAVEILVRDDPDVIPWKADINVPKDLKWNKQHINNAITQGILQGESIPDVAKRLQSVAQMNNTQAVRTARTAMTAANNAGHQAALKRAQGMGIKLRKQWIAALDGRTRSSHIALDGESVPLDHEFSNGLMYPGDPTGDPAEVYNCRCREVADVEGVDQGKIDDMALRNDNKLGDMTYSEWKSQHKKTSSGTSAQPVQNTESIRDQVSSLHIIHEFGKAYGAKARKEIVNRIVEADELTRNVWLKYAPNLEAPMPVAGRSYYNGRVHLDKYNVISGASHQPPFEVLFHEYGHNIDYIATSIFNPSSYTDRWYGDGLDTIKDILFKELNAKFTVKLTDKDIARKMFASQLKQGGMGAEWYLESTLKTWRRNSGLSRNDSEYVKIKNEIEGLKTDKQRFDYFMNNYEKFGVVTDWARNRYTEVNKRSVQEYIDSMTSNYGLKERANLSDMMEPYTWRYCNIEYPLGVGHGKDYASGGKHLATETFAEMFAMEMANPDALKLVKQELPETYAAYRQILKEMLQ